MILSAIVTTAIALSVPTAPAQAVPMLTHGSLTFAATPVQIAQWYPWPGSGPNNPSVEDECYQPANVHVNHEGGWLDLRVLRHSCFSDTENRKLPYTGAYLISPFTGSYGVYEARIYIPAALSGKAIADWPAFWLVGKNWPVGGEIDIMEGMHNDCHTYHYGTIADPRAIDAGCSSYRPRHWATFAVRWTPTGVIWYLNGYECGYVHFTAAMRTIGPMRIVLDYAVWDKKSWDTAPRTMRVSWVRVFKL